MDKLLFCFILHGKDGHLDTVVCVLRTLSCLHLQTHKMPSVSFISVIAFKRLVDCGEQLAFYTDRVWGLGYHHA